MRDLLCGGGFGELFELIEQRVPERWIGVEGRDEVRSELERERAEYVGERLILEELPECEPGRLGSAARQHAANFDGLSAAEHCSETHAMARGEEDSRRRRLGWAEIGEARDFEVGKSGCGGALRSRTVFAQYLDGRASEEASEGQGAGSVVGCDCNRRRCDALRGEPIDRRMACGEIVAIGVGDSALPSRIAQR